ncbi:MAG: hypothetical protein VB131_10020 [Burkholderia gladioli]
MTHSVPTRAEAKPLIEPTDRSIWPTISTQTMPSEITPTVEQSNSRLTRLSAETNTGLRLVKTLQMMIRPATTGSEPRSPARTRRPKAASVSPRPLACVTRTSARSSSGAGCEA